MRYVKMKRALALTVLLCAAGIVGLGSANHHPSQEAIAFAQRTSDLLLNELLAALFQEFNETTPANVEEGKQAISLIFHNANRDIRLIGGFTPLGGNNNLPDDSFERRSLARALRGEANTAVERAGGDWYYRRSIALSNTFHQACAACHTNFTPQYFQQTNNPGQWVGALSLRVPIKTDD